MNPCFENAVDSLEVGIKFYTDRTTSFPNKHAILAVYHAVELLLKAKLYEENFLLVFRKPASRITDDSQTVGLDEALGLLGNLGVQFDGDRISELRGLKRRRNRIEHFEYREEDEDSMLLGKALRFLVFFMSDHLGQRIEDHIGEDEYRTVHQLVLTYEERLAIADEAIAESMPAIPKERLDADPPAWCPECMNQTVTVEPGEMPYCQFCKDYIDLRRCEYCQEFVPVYEFDEEMEMCDLCQENHLR